MSFLRSLFCLKRFGQASNFSSTKDEFPWTDCVQWQTMSEGYEAEGFAGSVKCCSCKSEIKAYRQITGKDVLRFEQEIEGGHGRCTLHLPITFNAEASKWSAKTKVSGKKVLGRYKSNINGESYDVLKEVFFGTVKCANCQEMMHMYDRIIRYDGKDTTNWVLSRKDSKIIDEKIEC
jgi:hypothetical protein